MANQGSHNLRVLITSVDGNTDHPFQASQTVRDVRAFGYNKLVQNKAQIAESATWMEFGGKRIDDATVLATLVNPVKNPGAAADLTLNLAWTSQGG